MVISVSGGSGSGESSTHGPRGARAVVDFGLRQVERVFAFDVSAADVVADRAADDFPAGVQRECEFGFGNVPGRVLAQPNGLARADGCDGAVDLKNSSGRSAA